MTKRWIFRGWVVVLLVVGVIGFAVAQDDEGPMSNLHFVVVRDYNGKPVRNAAVILHPVNKKGKQSRGGLELKTDGDGKTNIEGIPYGPIRIQVLVSGFQTFGEDYEIDKEETLIVVKLKRPNGQYSSYEGKGDAAKAGDNKSSNTTAPDAKPPQTPPQ